MQDKIFLFVADDPRSRSDNDVLLPSPEGSTGDRLRSLFGLSVSDYLYFIDRRQLCPGRWSKNRARKIARECLGKAPWYRSILIGKKVAEACGGPGEWDIGALDIDREMLALTLPAAIPGPDLQDKARKLLAKLAPWIPWKTF